MVLWARDRLRDLLVLLAVLLVARAVNATLKAEGGRVLHELRDSVDLPSRVSGRILRLKTV